MYQQFEGSFESIGTTLPMRGLGAKMGSKNQNIKQGERAELFIPFDSSRRASHFSVYWMKNGQVMTMAILGHWMAILATFFEI